MSVAKIIELSCQSERSFEDAIQQGIQRAMSSLRGVSGAWVKEQQVSIDNGRVTGYRVNLVVTFLLDDGGSVDQG
jgi:flavin-binding protein dodecin